MSKTTEKLISALESLPEIQQRIDRVAEDFASGKNTYATIDAWILGELLGLDWDANEHILDEGYAYRHELEDSEFDHPFAENLGLLIGEVSESRYRELEALASSIQSNDKDLPLNEDEVALIREAYVEAHAKEQDFDDAKSCVKTVTSTNGVELMFTAGIGDGGEAFDAKSPYDKERSMDPSIFVRIDRDIS